MGWAELRSLWISTGWLSFAGCQAFRVQRHSERLLSEIPILCQPIYLRWNFCSKQRWALVTSLFSSKLARVGNVLCWMSSFFLFLLQSAMVDVRYIFNKLLSFGCRACSFSRYFGCVSSNGEPHWLFPYKEPYRHPGASALWPCESSHQPHLDLFCSLVLHHGPPHLLLVPGQPAQHRATLHHQHYTARELIHRGCHDAVYCHAEMSHVSFVNVSKTDDDPMLIAC